MGEGMRERVLDVGEQAHVIHELGGLEMSQSSPQRILRLANQRLEQRQEAAAALSAIAALPDELREPATLFFVHECSHQDIAAFLDLPVTTVNNRLHAARSQLKQRIITMVSDTLHSHALPDDFAHRIGRLIETRGDVVDALFDPAALPDLMTELTVSDEARKAGVGSCDAAPRWRHGSRAGSLFATQSSEGSDRPQLAPPLSRAGRPNAVRSIGAVARGRRPRRQEVG